MINNRMPFHENPKRTRKEGNFVALIEFENNPKYVVKESHDEWHDDRVSAEIDLRTLHTEQEDHRKLKTLLGDHIPEAIFMLGEKEEGKRRFYIAQERIYGKPTSRAALRENQEMRDQLISVIDIALDHYISTLNDKKTERLSGELMDLAENNLFFGHKYDEEADKLYFIDTFGMLMGTSPRTAVDRLQLFFETSGIDKDLFKSKIDLIKSCIR